MPTALITGVTGQDGLYLAELLASKGYEVHGLIRGVNHPRRALLEKLAPGIKLHVGDVTDVPSLMRVIGRSNPDEVYNLASQSFVGSSWEEASYTTDVTAKAVLLVLEAIRDHIGDDARRVRFFQASSSEVFGKAEETPQNERTRFWPRSPYGAAKAYGHHITVNYRESFGMHASSGIMYNHESPRRGSQFVTRKVTRAVAAIHLGLEKELVLGSLDTRRDWGFAGDYVKAMWLMLQQDEPDDYVLATGKTHSIRDLVSAAFACIDVEDWAPYVRQDPAFMRPAESEQLVGDATKAHQVLGWKPEVQFAELVRVMVEGDVAALRAGWA